MTEIFDDLQWDIEDMPVGFSTPDELFEYSYRAKTTCPDCGSEISGIANYHSHYEDMSMAYLSHIDYEPCQCEEDNDDYEYEDDEPDDLKNIFHN